MPETGPLALPAPSRGAMYGKADLVLLVDMRAGELESWFEVPDWLRVALGQGIGRSIGAAIARPGKQTVTLVGDGGMGIAASDIETMIHYNCLAWWC